MKYLLDTNVVIKMLAGNRGIVSRVHQTDMLDIGISAIVAHDLFYGALKSSRTSFNLARLQAMQFPRVVFDDESAMRAAAVKTMLAAAGMLIGPYDLLIAGQALANRLILVTHNTREFARIPSLQIEDWQD